MVKILLQLDFSSILLLSLDKPLVGSLEGDVGLEEETAINQINLCSLRRGTAD